MSEWVNVKDRLPKPMQKVWIYWRDREVVMGRRIYEGEEELNQPPEEGWYSFEDDKCRWTNWWMPLNKPKPPQDIMVNK